MRLLLALVLGFSYGLSAHASGDKIEYGKINEPMIIWLVQKDFGLYLDSNQKVRLLVSSHDYTLYNQFGHFLSREKIREETGALLSYYLNFTVPSCPTKLTIINRKISKIENKCAQNLDD